MKRYFLFTGDEYYPRGGMDDFEGEFGSEKAVMAAWNKIKGRGYNNDWMHVLEVDTGRMGVAKNDKIEWGD